jgi:hypothetical protein
MYNAEKSAGLKSVPVVPVWHGFCDIARLNGAVSVPDDLLYFHMKHSLIVILLLAGLLGGCSSGDKPWERNLDKDKKEMEMSGWTYFETLGLPGDGKLTSEADGGARPGTSIVASWTDKGALQNKEYGQTTYFHTLHNYSKPDGDSFVLVFRKGVPGLR